MTSTLNQPEVPVPVFVVGVGRSGTSLLQSMLAAHPLLYLPPETSILRRFVLTGRVPSGNDVASLATAWDVLKADGKFQRLRVASLGEFAALVRAGGNNDWYSSLLAGIAKREGKLWFGDKDPKLIEHLGSIRAAWPDAKILHIMRDPRDVLASKKKADWAKGRPSIFHLVAYRYQFQLAARFGQRHGEDSYFEICYEELIANPEQVAQDVCRFLGMSFDMAMLSFTEEAKRLVSDEERAWKRETLGPILNKNTGKWRDQLTPFEIELTERCCRPALIRNPACSESVSSVEISLIGRLAAHLIATLVIIASCLLLIGKRMSRPKYRGAP